MSEDSAANIPTHYPEVLTREGPDYKPEDAEAAEWERTPQAYLEVEWDYKETDRALNMDFRHYLASLPRAELERMSQAHIEEMNRKRAEQGVDPVDPATIPASTLSQMLRPDWHAHMPKSDSEDDQSTWQTFKAQWPEHMQINLEGLRELDTKLRILASDEQLRKEVEDTRAEKLEVIKAGVDFYRGDKKMDQLARDIAKIYRTAGESNRTLTPAEQKHIERLQAQQAEVRANRGRYITTPEIKAGAREVIAKLINRERRRDYERGIVLTDQMRQIIDELLPSLVQGRPALLVGETGGAKTALAEFISRSYFGKEPEFIAGYGDVNSYQMVGKTTLENEDGTPVTGFAYGPLVRAMESGKPLILDEITAMPPEFLKRLNKILQMRPGDKFTVQENSGHEVLIKPGFVIIATANEKSKRYKGVEDLSVEFQNRFGANIIRVHYPDNDVPFGGKPVENEIIARAALSDSSGQVMPVIPEEELGNFIRACHVSQQVFSGNFGEGFEDYVSPEQRVDRKPGLEETVLAPRTMVAVLEKVRDSYGKLTLDQVLRQFVEGIKSENDRRQTILILRGNGFLQPTPDSQPNP